MALVNFQHQIPPAPTARSQRILFLYSPTQKPYLGLLKMVIIENLKEKRHSFKLEFASSQGMEPQLLGQIAAQFAYVVITCPAAASMVCPPDISFSEACGSIYKNKYLILPDPHHIKAVPHGKFVIERFLDKIFHPEKFIKFPKFQWRKLSAQEDFENFLQLAQTEAIFAAFDIETVKRNRGISCFGMAMLLRDGRIFVGVVDCTDDDFLERAGKLARSRVPKTAQNGIYDNLYHLRWNIPVENYVHDTAAWMHSLYCELPKDLGFLGSFFLRDFEYWKFEGKAAKSKEDYLTYNAKDCYATLCTAIAQLVEAPKYAKNNFIINFPRIFPCILMSAHGMLVDEDVRTDVRLEAETELQRLENEMAVMTSIPGFNSGSWQQVEKLFLALGVKLKSTEEKDLLAVAARHPLYEIFVDRILEIRGLKKAIGTYYKAELLDGVLFYDLIPYGTETGRFASKKSSFWCGANIQNQPPYAKCYLMAPEGWEICETDNEQSESRTTAYISGDVALQQTLESGRDFHSQNAVLFFGSEYEVARKKQEDGSDSPMRALAKRINHAVSYNMGENEFVRNAGHRVMELARRLLGLSPYWSHKQIAQYLIGLFDKAYPKVRNDFQRDVIREITFTKMLVGATGWTRRFFRDPNTNKPALNAAVAHGPQSLSVQILNEGLLKLYIKVLDGLPIRLLAQVHDSVLKLRKIGDDASLAIAKECLYTPTQVKGKTLVIPTATKVSGKYWAKRKKKS